MRKQGAGISYKACFEKEKDENEGNGIMVKPK